MTTKKNNGNNYSMFIHNQDLNMVGQKIRYLESNNSGCHSFPSKKEASSNFMVAFTICPDSGAQEKNVSLLLPFPSLPARKSWDLMT